MVSVVMEVEVDAMAAEDGPDLVLLQVFEAEVVDACAPAQITEGGGFAADEE